MAFLKVKFLKKSVRFQSVGFIAKKNENIK